MHSHQHAANVRTSWVAPSDSQAFFFFLSPMQEETRLPFLVTQTNTQKRCKLGDQNPGKEDQASSS